MLSAAWHISFVFARVSVDSRSRRSLTLLSLMPNTKRSRRISSEVMTAKSQPSASFLNADHSFRQVPASDD